MSNETQPVFGPPRGELFLLSAPSGAGKTTLTRHVLEELSGDEGGGLEFSISHTTRAPRQGEVDGRDYHFVTAAEFQRMIAADLFLEWAEVHGNYYGTSAEAVLPYLERGIDMLVDLDVQGAERMMHRFPEAYSIFILPPSYADLVRRLEGRKLDGADQIARRLAVSLWEIKRYDRYQYVIINDDAKRAGRALQAIVLEKRQRRSRMQARVEAILTSFSEPKAPT
ncbi:MAG: guanylate kinase [Thermoanaerobaculia bacterium]